MELRLEKPAGRWGEAFAVGNGQIGGMIYGGIGEERIDLSENTFYSGRASEKNNQPGAAEAFTKMRTFAVQEDFERVRKAAKGFMGMRQNYGTNLPVGSLLIGTGLDKAQAANYERKLNLTEGVVTSRWLQNGRWVETKAFAPHERKCLYYEITAKEKILELNLRFVSPRETDSVDYNEWGLCFMCDARETMHSDGMEGVRLLGKAVVHTDGFPERTGDGMKIRTASKLSVYVVMATNFEELRDVSHLERTDLKELRDAAYPVLTGQERRRKEAALYWMQMKLDQYMARLEGITSDELYLEHASDMREKAERVSLQIEGDGYVKVIAQMFQMGRYLLYSASREDSVLPAHLQGVWNDNVACRIGWTCDMHLDINTQMNYWPAETTNLPETTKPLFSWIRDDLAVNGRKTARVSYGLDGWVAELVSNAWGFAAPYWGRSLSPCPTGGVWILTHMWEHYLASQDQSFLEKEAYPLIEEAVRFFESYVFEDGSGYLTCGPSISPENSFAVQDDSGNVQEYHISNGCTYEILMIRELFRIYLDASEVLHRDNSRVRSVREKIVRLLPYRITEDGRIAEWSHGYPAKDVQHRHTSHLLGLFPFAQITEEDKKLAKAAENSIQAKLTPEENWEDTGWARSMLMLYEARLGHPNEAWRHICAMLNRLLEPNGFIIHPPTRGAGAFDNVYEMDGNTGLTTCIAEMLMQSQNGVIRLLPCIPKEWKKGHVSGLIARGGVIVEIEWEDGQCRAWLTAKKDGTYEVAKGRVKKKVTLKANHRTQVWE